MIKTIREAINFLEKERGFEINDLRAFKWEIIDEDINFKTRTNQEVIDYANEQKENGSY